MTHESDANFEAAADEPRMEPSDGPIVEVVEPIAAPRSRPVLTIVCAIIIGLAFLVAQMLAVAGFVIAAMQENPRLDGAQWVLDHQHDGDLVAVTVLAGAAASVPLTLAFGWILGGRSARRTLALRPTSIRSIVGWTLVTLAFCLVADGITSMLQGDVVPSFMLDAYRTVTYPALFWLALVVAAPLSEELLFRGLIFGGLINTRLGFAGTAIVTSLMWAALHVQYSIAGLTQVAVGGLIFAAARQRTRSIYPCLIMHGAWNAGAIIETAYLAS